MMTMRWKVEVVGVSCDGFAEAQYLWALGKEKGGGPIGPIIVLGVEHR